MERKQIRKDCFGCAPGKKDCQVLTENICLTRECPFFKTREEFYRGLHKAEAKQEGVKPGRKGRAVRCLESGACFPSVAAAAVAFGTHPNYIAAVCRGEKDSYAGLRFAYIE